MTCACKTLCCGDDHLIQVDLNYPTLLAFRCKFRRGLSIRLGVGFRNLAKNSWIQSTVLVVAKRDDRLSSVPRLAFCISPWVRCVPKRLVRANPTDASRPQAVNGFS
jgi:hypothetical protein